MNIAAEFLMAILVAMIVMCVIGRMWRLTLRLRDEFFPFQTPRRVAAHLPQTASLLRQG